MQAGRRGKCEMCAVTLLRTLLSASLARPKSRPGPAAWRDGRRGGGVNRRRLAGGGRTGGRAAAGQARSADGTPVVGTVAPGGQRGEHGRRARATRQQDSARPRIALSPALTSVSREASLMTGMLDKQQTSE